MSKEMILFKKDLSDWLIIRFKKCFDINIINARYHLRIMKNLETFNPMYH